MSDVIHSIRSLSKLLSSREVYSKDCKTFKMEHFAKRIVPECRCTTRRFQGKVRFHGTWDFIKYFVKNTSKKFCNYTATF